MFAAFVTAAVATVRRPDTHKRLMVLAPISTGLPSFGAVTNPNAGLMGGTLAAAVVDVPIAVAVVRDWRSGRLHRAYVIGGICMVLVHALRIPFSKTVAWHWSTDALLALAA